MAKKPTIEAKPDNTIAGDWGDLTAIEALEVLIGGIEVLEADRLYQGKPGPGFCEIAAKWLGSKACRKEVKENMKELQKNGQSKN